MLDRIARGEFLGYELHALRRLRRFIRWEADEDLHQEIRMWSVEAAGRFDSERGRWETFLYRHLQIRSWQKIRREYVLRRRPVKGIVLLRHDPVGSGSVISQLEFQELLSSLSDPTRRIALKALRNHSTGIRSTRAKSELRNRVRQFISGVK